METSVHHLPPQSAPQPVDPQQLDSEVLGLYIVQSQPYPDEPQVNTLIYTTSSPPIAARIACKTSFEEYRLSVNSASFSASWSLK